MDENVLASMKRWPDVPHAYGWLSLSEQGQWLVHPDADACAGDSTWPPGEAIESTQIRQFISRNYACDGEGRWFFQNGPQRVYVRLDAAPYVFSTGSPTTTLCSHNGIRVERIRSWWLDHTGRMFALTNLGGGLVAGRDLASVLDTMRTEDGQPVDAALELIDLVACSAPSTEVLQPVMQISLVDDASSNQYGSTVPLYICRAEDIPRHLGFVPCPRDS